MHAQGTLPGVLEVQHRQRTPRSARHDLLAAASRWLLPRMKKSSWKHHRLPYASWGSGRGRHRKGPAASDSVGPPLLLLARRMAGADGCCRLSSRCRCCCYRLACAFCWTCPFCCCHVFSSPSCPCCACACASSPSSPCPLLRCARGKKNHVVECDSSQREDNRREQTMS